MSNHNGYGMTDTLAGNRTIHEPPRSTAYYYADLERLKKKNQKEEVQEETRQNPDELSEYVESNEVINDGAVREVPPLRDRGRQWSLPEYSTPENRKVPEETYSTAGTFPMPEPKEKEPLLAELEVVGRLPLTQLESSGVRRSRSWYLCCPNVGDEEISRDSSWRYSSLRPVTAPPLPGQNGINVMVTSQSSGREDIISLRAERDALARALASERQRAATAARAHDARLAELHGVIAELVRRRAADKHSRAIPEEEVSDECESTTQPAGELENDQDLSRTEQNDTSSILSPAELPTPQEKVEQQELPDDTTDTSTNEAVRNNCNPSVQVTSAHETDNCDTSLNLSEKHSELCFNTARCCQVVRHSHSPSAGGSCEREHGSPHGTGRCESRQAKLASRVRLRRTEDCDVNHVGNEEGWCAEMAEELALDVCAQADLREALVAATNDGSTLSASVWAWRTRCARLQADCRVLKAALNNATDTAHRLSCACAVQESNSVSLCCALRAADRALETYDVLLALAETTSTEDASQREAAELVARQLLARLDSEQNAVAIGEPLLSPGPWHTHDTRCGDIESWTSECDARLRSHAARLKSETVSLRNLRPSPHLFSYHDIEDEELAKSVGNLNMEEMEAAVMMQEVLTAREVRATARVAELTLTKQKDYKDQRSDGHSTRSRRRRDHHWLETQASETDL